jgi:hypothetical protein
LYFHEAKRYLSGLMKLELVARGSHDPTNSNEDSHASIYIYIDHVNRVVVPSESIIVSSCNPLIRRFTSKLIETYVDLGWIHREQNGLTKFNTLL